MDKEDKIIIFESQEIRRVWYNNEWWFSVIDICGILTESVNAVLIGVSWSKG